jgi:hypothetical protein
LERKGEWPEVGGLALLRGSLAKKRSNQGETYDVDFDICRLGGRIANYSLAIWRIFKQGPTTPSAHPTLKAVGFSFPAPDRPRSRSQDEAVECGLHFAFRMDLSFSPYFGKLHHANHAL